MRERLISTIQGVVLSGTGQIDTERRWGDGPERRRVEAISRGRRTQDADVARAASEANPPARQVAHVGARDGLKAGGSLFAVVAKVDAKDAA